MLFVARNNNNKLFLIVSSGNEEQCWLTSTIFISSNRICNSLLRETHEAHLGLLTLLPFVRAWPKKHSTTKRTYFIILPPIPSCHLWFNLCRRSPLSGKKQVPIHWSSRFQCRRRWQRRHWLSRAVLAPQRSTGDSNSWSLLLPILLVPPSKRSNYSTDRFTQRFGAIIFNY